MDTLWSFLILGVVWFCVGGVFWAGLLLVVVTRGSVWCFGVVAVVLLGLGGLYVGVLFALMDVFGV